MTYHFLFKLIVWNMPGATVIFLTHFTAFTSYQLTSLSNSLLVTFIVLLSAKLWMPDLVNHRNKSVRNTLKRIGPNTDPCGIPERGISNMLQVLSVFAFCFLFFRWVLRKVTVLNCACKHEVWPLEIMRDTVRSFR